ncbi:hypothetical protein SAMN02927924_01337 [Sphingobium faniae]|nr:hypothetical protein SAMN02927924_01337 [Sphingobium faniae]
MLRLVTGCGAGKPAATPTDILNLALKLGEAAADCRLTLVCIRASRNPGSCSRYIHLSDRADRPWLIRISNHRMPAKNWQAVPHLDLVSLDGQSGFREAAEFLQRVGRGEAEWFDPCDRDERAAVRSRRSRKVRRK